MQTRTGAQLVVDSLYNEGVRTLFGIPGVDTLGVYNALLDQPDIRVPCSWPTASTDRPVRSASH
jgi:hypothetical protein